MRIFPGDVGENVAPPGEIDTEYRAREHLDPGRFSDDLRFLRTCFTIPPNGHSLSGALESRVYPALTGYESGSHGPACPNSRKA